MPIFRLNFIHSPFNFLAKHFQYYAIMLIDHLALDPSYAHTNVPLR